MATKRKYSEKNTKFCRNLKKVSPLKKSLPNFIYQEVAYMEEKFMTHLKLHH